MTLRRLAILSALAHLGATITPIPTRPPTIKPKSGKDRSKVKAARKQRSRNRK